jgi:hypothetical protein
MYYPYLSLTHVLIGLFTDMDIARQGMQQRYGLQGQAAQAHDCPLEISVVKACT